MGIRTNDAKGFVEGVIRYMRTESPSASRFIPKVQRLLYKMTIRDKSEKVALLDSAIEMAEPQKQKIQKILESLVEHRLDIEYRIMPELIAGFRVQIGDFVIDTSFSHQLDSLGETLL